jgi:hypothetical protein
VVYIYIYIYIYKVQNIHVLVFKECLTMGVNRPKKTKIYIYFCLFWTIYSHCGHHNISPVIKCIYNAVLRCYRIYPRQYFTRLSNASTSMLNLVIKDIFTHALPGYQMHPRSCIVLLDCIPEIRQLEHDVWSRLLYCFIVPDCMLYIDVDTFDNLVKHRS